MFYSVADMAIMAQFHFLAAFRMPTEIMVFFIANRKISPEMVAVGKISIFDPIFLIPQFYRHSSNSIPFMNVTALTTFQDSIASSCKNHNSLVRTGFHNRAVGTVSFKARNQKISLRRSSIPPHIALSAILNSAWDIDTGWHLYVMKMTFSFHNNQYLPLKYKLKKLWDICCSFWSNYVFI